jgi:hypothetical protein
VSLEVVRVRSAFETGLEAHARGSGHVHVDGNADLERQRMQQKGGGGRQQGSAMSHREVEALLLASGGFEVDAILKHGVLPRFRQLEPRTLPPQRSTVGARNANVSK